MGIQTPPEFLAPHQVKHRGQFRLMKPGNHTSPSFSIRFGIGDQTKNHSIGAQSKEPVGHIIPSVLFSSFFL